MPTGVYERKLKARVKVICATCSKTAWLVPWEAKKYKFCSLECYHRSKQFAVMVSKNGRKVGHYRAKNGHDWGEKISLAKIGKPRPNMRREKHPLWKGEAAKNGVLEQEWKAAVLARDKYKCVHCGSTKRGRNGLCAHHIQERKTHPHLRFEVSNGQTLCASCHMKEHERRRR